MTPRATCDGSRPAEAAPVRIDPEPLAAIETRAKADHAATREIICQALRRFLDVAWLIAISQSETNTSKPANGSQPSEGPAAQLDMNPLRHKVCVARPEGLEPPTF